MQTTKYNSKGLSPISARVSAAIAFITILIGVLSLYWVYAGKVGNPPPIPEPIHAANNIQVVPPIYITVIADNPTNASQTLSKCLPALGNLGIYPYPESKSRKKSK